MDQIEITGGRKKKVIKNNVMDNDSSKKGSKRRGSKKGSKRRGSKKDSKKGI
jgi:hypothetical protein